MTNFLHEGLHSILHLFLQKMSASRYCQIINTVDIVLKLYIKKWRVIENIPDIHSHKKKEELSNAPPSNA